MFWGTWAVALANVQATFGLSDGQLGILLAVSIALAGITGAVISHHAERFGSGRMLAGALGVWAVLLVGAGLAPTLAFFVVAFGLTEVAGGCVDTAMNAASAARLMGRPGALVRFHAFFNTGALLGAAVAGIVLHAGISWRWLWPTLALVAAALAVWTRRTVGEATLPALPTGLAPGASGDGGDTRGPLRRLRRDGLLLLLFIFALAEVTEGGVDTWGVLYLRTHLAAGVLLGAGAYVVGQSSRARSSVAPDRPGRRRLDRLRRHPGRVGLARRRGRSRGSRTRCGRRIALLAPRDERRLEGGITADIGGRDLHRGGLLRPGGRGPVGGLGLGHLRPQPGSPGPGRGGRPGRAHFAVQPGPQPAHQTRGLACRVPPLAGHSPSMIHIT